MEEEDGPEDKEGLVEVQSGVDCVWRGSGGSWTLILPPANMTSSSGASYRGSVLPINCTPQHWRLAINVKFIIRADLTILSYSEGNPLKGPVNKETEETKRGNEEDDDDKDSLTEREKGPDMDQYL